MGTIHTYRDLIAWQKGMELARMVDRVTRAMPPEEQFGLTSQMRRASVSIPSNIAEGYARQSSGDYVRFLKMSRGSLAELSTQFELTVLMNLIIPDEQVSSLLAELDRILQGLIRSLLSRRSP